MKKLLIPAIVWAVVLGMVLGIAAMSEAIVFTGKEGVYLLSCPVWSYENGVIDKVFVKEKMVLSKEGGSSMWLLYKMEGTKTVPLMGGPFVHSQNSGHWFFWPGNPNDTEIAMIVDVFGVASAKHVLGQCALRLLEREKPTVTPCGFSPVPAWCK